MRIYWVHVRISWPHMLLVPTSPIHQATNHSSGNQRRAWMNKFNRDHWLRGIPSSIMIIAAIIISLCNRHYTWPWLLLPRTCVYPVIYCLIIFNCVKFIKVPRDQWKWLKRYLRSGISNRGTCMCIRQFDTNSTCVCGNKRNVLTPPEFWGNADLVHSRDFGSKNWIVHSNFSTWLLIHFSPLFVTWEKPDE